MAHSYNPSKVKQEPYEFVDADFDVPALEEPYFAVPWPPHAPIGYGAPELPTGQLNYHQRMEHLEEIYQEQKKQINQHPIDEQVMIHSAIQQKKKYVNAKAPWTKNFLYAKATTKYQQMKMEIRRQAIQEHQLQIQKHHLSELSDRRNPRRSATANLRVGAYREDDDIEFLGCYSNGVPKKLVKRKKIQKK